MKLNNTSLLAILIVVVALPATLSVIAYLITKNPALRPLARTLNDEEIHKGLAMDVEIVAHIHWTTQRKKTFTQRELSNVIQRAFNTHGVTVRTVFEQIDSTGPVSITYQVGRNTIGPTRINNAADSVNSAIAVYRMYQMSAPNRRKKQ